jgi:hypothetical protein
MNFSFLLMSLILLLFLHVKRKMEKIRRAIYHEIPANHRGGYQDLLTQQEYRSLEIDRNSGDE